MKEIYLIRHGRQSSKLCNVDVSLDDAGRQQSHLVADRLASYGLEALYASGLKRAQETAQAISETTGLSVRTVEAFHESCFLALCARAVEGRPDEAPCGAASVFSEPVPGAVCDDALFAVDAALR